jgi:hypothetical protein
MAGVFIILIIGGIWMILSAMILISVYITSSRFNQGECPLIDAETFVERKVIPDRPEKLDLGSRSRVVQH